MSPVRQAAGGSFLFHRLQIMMLWHVSCSRSAACAVLAPEGLQPAAHPAGSGACTVGTEQMPFISAGQRLTHQSAGWKKWWRKARALGHLLSRFVVLRSFDTCFFFTFQRVCVAIAGCDILGNKKKLCRDDCGPLIKHLQRDLFAGSCHRISSIFSVPRQNAAFLYESGEGEKGREGCCKVIKT